MPQQEERSASPTPLESPQTTTAVAEKPDTQAGMARPWNVVLLDSDHHTYEYVIEMMCKLFRRTPEEAHAIARTVDNNGRAVCMTTHKELAELKREQIVSYGSDPYATEPRGSMNAVIEPAMSDDNSHEENNGANLPENNESGGASSAGAN